MKTFETEKGLVLTLIDLKGKDYLPVQQRVLWFRSEKPDWSIETEIFRLENNAALAKATVKNNEGRIMATSHKFEDAKGFGDYQEKAETGAVGRALALVGYGTQFAPDLDEEDRIVDAPLERKTGPKNSGVAVIHAAFCPQCKKPMKDSLYPNKITGEIDWYCRDCKKSVPKTADGGSMNESDVPF